MKILANFVYFDDNGDVTLLGFSDSRDNPQTYIIMNMSNTPDEQDISLGMEGIHIETSIKNLDGYNIIENIIENDETIIIIEFTLTISKKSNIDRITIHLNANFELKNESGIEITLHDAIFRFKRRLYDLRRK